MPIIIMIFPQMFCLYLQMPKDSESLSTFTVVLLKRISESFSEREKLGLWKIKRKVGGWH